MIDLINALGANKKDGLKLIFKPSFSYAAKAIPPHIAECMIISTAGLL